MLTTQVENLHAVSHFKHETFSALQYATDFGMVAKESLKRVSKWAAKNNTHPSSYNPLSQKGMLLVNVNFMVHASKKWRRYDAGLARQLPPSEAKDRKKWDNKGLGRSFNTSIVCKTTSSVQWPGQHSVTGLSRD